MRHELDRAIDAAWERVPPSVDAVRWSKFLLQACEMLQNHLPPMGRRALTIGKGFLAGDCGVDEVSAAKVACLQYLDGLSATQRAQEPGAVAVRVLTMALPPIQTKDDEDFLDMLDIFLRFVLFLENIEAQLLAALMSLFPEA